MQNFDFSRQRIDRAFRTLCSKLYFRAESQKLDRIVESFAQHYYRCNPTTILHSADIVYAIAYSLLLLNTDLYVSQDSQMMTRQHFVKNTLATVKSLIYPSTTSSESSLSITSSKDDAFGSIRRRSKLIQQIANYKKSPDQKAWLADIENLLKDIYNSIKANRIDRISEKVTIDARKRKCKSVFVSNSAALLSLHPKNKKLENTSLASFCSNDKNIIKQGLVMKKHIKENNDTKSRNYRHWELCYLILTTTHLTCYRAIPSTGAKSRRRQSFLLWCNYTSPTLRSVITQISEWEPDTSQPPILDTKINHSYCNIVPPPGWSNQRPHVFRLETGEGGLCLFECIDMFQVESWVEKVNSAAAKISKGGLVGAVSNVDYGWGEECNGVIVTWHPPMSCMVNSELDLDHQLKELKKQIQIISHDLDQHRRLKFDDKVHF
ncbi:SEC7-like protein [Backusella circina FSU 941]|nr:SEC7-like protein [Backusella circina FSU 941]